LHSQLHLIRMKKATKIGISVLVIGVVVLIISATLNLWMKELVCRQLDQNIASADSLTISYGDIKVSVFAGKAWFKDAYFRSDTAAWDETDKAITECKIDKLSLDGINYYNWLVRRQLNLKGLTIVNPHLRMRFHHNKEKEKEGDVLQEQIEKDRQQRLENMLQVARIFIDDATLSRLTIDHANVRAEATNDSLKIIVPEFTMSLYDLGYNIKDSLPHYNDSVFHFLFRDVKVTIPEVSLQLSVNELKAEPNGMVEVKDVWIKSFLNPQNTESVITGVDRISIGGFDAAKFNAIKQMNVKNIHFNHPYAELRIDESNQKAKHQLPNQKKKADLNKPQTEIDVINQKMADANLDVIMEFFTGLTVDTIFLHDATVSVKSITTAFCLQATHISTTLHEVGYSLIDKIPYHYNDSVYRFSLGNLEVITPDSLIAISAQNMHYDNGGAFSLGKTHICHIVDKWRLSHLMGDVPSTWMDMYVDSVYTSSKNIVKEATTLEQGFHLDSLWADVRSMSVFRDNTCQVKEPYHLPQYFLMQVKYPFVINCINANVKKIHINMAQAKDCVGKLDLGPINLKVKNVTPIRNSIITTTAKGKMGKASIDAVFNMKVNRSCTWDITLNAKNVDAHHLDSMVYPIVGMTIGCDIHHLHANYGGDSNIAKGTFCMTYDHVDIFADKNSHSPYKIVRDLSGLINSAGKTIVNPSNPSAPGKEPVAYQIKWKNNPMEDPSMFYIGPVIDGCIKTMLPGLFLSKRVNRK